MLIDRYLPRFDVSHICEVAVEASSDEAWAAIQQTDLRDPVINALFALRELPARIARRLRGEAPPPSVPVRPLTFGDLAREGPAWVSLAEEPGVELVLGSVGRFWRKDYDPRRIAPAEFARFGEPGYAKLALSLAIRPTVDGVILRYEARTAATDTAARRRFLRYWRVIQPGVAVVMRRALRKIAAEAECKARAGRVVAVT